ncbi:hypothetical protein [Spirosoma validum]|uniref:Uncharacterized protein n=1 Tax=Spirosoma validum TaxID=2771355 RepID=A0A927AYS1_9BACT|nr:hypothetical protein [Spirosoma validum]MBD2752236.1 hypothetical protein [Spirosoma validum]
MKTLIYLLLFVTSATFSQSDELFKKGNTAYVESSSKNENVQETANAFVENLREWGYWKLVSDSQSADFIIKLDVEASKGITATSWGGTSIASAAKFYDKNNTVLWESDTYRVSPNGTNGFNAKKASARKLVKAIEKKFK